MTSSTLFIGAGFIVVSCAIAYFVWPILRDDMNRTVSGVYKRPDVTSMAMLAFGSMLTAGVPSLALWMRVTA